MNKLEEYQVGITQTIQISNLSYSIKIGVTGNWIRFLYEVKLYDFSDGIIPSFGNLDLHAGCFKGEDLESKGVQFYKDLAHDSSRQLQSAIFLPF